MKIEQLLVQHFYITKQVTLQGIGTFTLSPDFITPPDSDKDIVLPENAVSFEYNSKATEDEALINYIVQQTRKIKPLATADLESYLMLATQFLNIGKPLKIEGIGLLEKTQQGEYQFFQSQFINTKVEDAQIQLKEKSREDISFANEAKPSGNNKKIIVIIASIVALAVISWAVWYFLNNKKTAEPVAEKIIEQMQPASIQTSDTTKPDTIAAVQHKPDSIVQTAKIENGYSFKIVLKNYPNLIAAQKAYNRLTGYGHKLLLYTADSVTYKVAMPFTRPVADTTYAKDSVRKTLFGGNPYVDLK
ncbi:MAG: hypothetical protein RIR31_42 [Bacteroidota bacterium]|jgi:hypothetical protein